MIIRDVTLTVMDNALRNCHLTQSIRAAILKATFIDCAVGIFQFALAVRLTIFVLSLIYGTIDAK